MYQSWVEISRKAILYNLKQYKELVGKTVAIMPIIKSNAYGHGMVEMAQLISPQVDWIGVANTGEALMLRQAGIKKNIFALSYAPAHELREAIQHRIDLPVYDTNRAQRINTIAKKVKRKARVHIKVDTGASRIGVSAANALQLIKNIQKLSHITIAGIYSHFASSEQDATYTRRQQRVFNELLHKLEREKIKIPTTHLACSAALLSAPTSHFNLVRLGLSLYGLWPSEKVRRLAQKKYPWLTLQPALSWKTKVIQVKTIKQGSRVSYGGTYVAKKKMKIAVIAVGYWEGYDRGLSNIGVVVIKGKRCPVIGRVCMNLSMVDVSRLSQVNLDDEVVLLGKDNPAEEMAEKIGTINYEIVTRINPLLQRVYTT